MSLTPALLVKGNNTEQHKSQLTDCDFHAYACTNRKQKQRKWVRQRCASERGKHDIEVTTTHTPHTTNETSATLHTGLGAHLQ
jgi:hypothetical protein